MSEEQKPSRKKRIVLTIIFSSLMITAGLLAGKLYEMKSFEDADITEQMGVPTFERTPINNQKNMTDIEQMEVMMNTIDVLLKFDNFIAMGVNGTVFLMSYPLDEKIFQINQYEMIEYDIDSQELGNSFVIKNNAFNSTSYKRVNFYKNGTGFNVDGQYFICDDAWKLENCNKVDFIEKEN